MKKILPGFFALFLCLSSYAQNNVGIGTATPDPSSVLDLTSANQGFLVPRTRIANITTPTLGLLIFDTDSSCFMLYNGTLWRNLCNSPGTGQAPISAFNNSIYINSNGTVTIVDSNGLHSLTTTLGAWLTGGNAGTTAGANFVGTTDAQDVVVKSNNNEVMRATQSGAVGINQSVPDPTSILDITSTTKGVLFPALTTTQRDAITTPAVGLTVYNTDVNVHQFWNGTCWVNVGQTVCSFVYSLSQSHTSDCLFKSNFNSVSDTITVSLISGTPSPVILSAAGVPAGVLVNFSNNYLIPTQTSVMTFTALPSAPNGVYTITILATSGSTVQTLTYTLTIYDFAVTLVPTSGTVTLAAAQAGGVIDTATLSIGNPTACNVSAGNATLTYSISPNTSALSVSFGNPNLPIPGSTTMSITSSCALPGTYQIYVTSTVGVSVSTSIFTLTILGPAPILISANIQNVNLYTLAGSPSCPVIDTFIVEPGVTVGSDTNTLPAMTTGNFVAGSHIVIVNNGTIEGAGGDGGENNGGILSCTAVSGSPGGTAIILTTSNVTINNLGTIAGGGGGGGSGGGETSNCAQLKSGAGGGGGAGSVPGNGGGGGTSYTCVSGNNGTAITGGAGGAGCSNGGCFLGTAQSGSGGAGGNPGQPGVAGSSGSGGIIGGTGLCSAGSGGAAGYSLWIGLNSYTLTGAALIGPTHP